MQSEIYNKAHIQTLLRQISVYGLLICSIKSWTQIGVGRLHPSNVNAKVNGWIAYKLGAEINDFIVYEPRKRKVNYFFPHAKYNACTKLYFTFSALE